jgi:uncharacterized protein
MREHHALVWRGLDAWRAEYADVVLQADRLLARGTQIGVEPLPYRLSYSLDTAVGFVTRRLTADAVGAGWSRRLDLSRDAEGAWHVSADARGNTDLPDPGGDTERFAEALDCDIANCPVTNAMPVLRERLMDGGEPRDFVMAWVSVPDLSVRRSEQRYEPVNGSTVRYVALDGDFRTDIGLDGSGLVVHYPDVAERVQG